MNLPTISIVMPTYNSALTLDVCLTNIKSQQYPQELVEIIIGDGGSTDNTLEIAKKFKVKVVKITDRIKQGAEYNRSMAAQRAKNELLAVIDHDNIMPHNKWLREMVQPFLDDKSIVGVETLRYEYDPQANLLGRYFQLFGVNDILPFYLGKADRLAYLFDNPRDYGVFRQAQVIEKNKYFVVGFHPDYIPTLGSNGFMVRRELLFREAQVSPDMYFHIDVNVDLIRKGFSRYAFIKDVIRHETQERGLRAYLDRRKLFMEKYYIEVISNRRYSVYEANDKRKLIWFIFLSLTFVVPICDAISGYRKIRDKAWFLHPFMCFSIVVLYSWVMLKKSICFITDG